MTPVLVTPESDNEPESTRRVSTTGRVSPVDVSILPVIVSNKVLELLVPDDQVCVGVVVLTGIWFILRRRASSWDLVIQV